MCKSDILQLIMKTTGLDEGYANNTIIFWSTYLESTDAYNFLYVVFNYEKSYKSALENENKYIPRRMINCVLRLVNVANDMEIIRPSKDVFKISYIISCIDALWKLSGLKAENKYVSFFNKYISAIDKQILFDRLNVYDADRNYDIITTFAKALYEIRNNGVHESDYWDIHFHDGKEPDCAMLFTVNMSPVKDGGKRDLIFDTTLTYGSFAKIFVKTCASFIKDFINENSIEDID